MNGFTPDPSLLDDSFVRQHESSYDVILISQVLEHVADLDPMVDRLRRLLRADGLVATAVPHFRSWISRLQGRRDMFITPPEHLNYFTSKGLISLYMRHRLRVINRETVSRFDPRRITARLKSKLLGKLASISLDIFLGMADQVNKGMYLNMYFRKT